MNKPGNLTLNIRGYLMQLDIPKVMGILNVTPDSFFADSRNISEAKVRDRIYEMIKEGVEIIDVGGCSTRPGYQAPSLQEEWQRVKLGCTIVREIAPDMPLSLDTFRSEIALMAIEEFGVDIINDISGGTDPEMWGLIAEKRVVYVLTHNPEIANYKDVTAETITWLSKRLNELHRLGVNDVVIDPGFGFAKSIEENFRLLDELDEIAQIGLPILAGLSRKSMIYKTLGCSSAEALTGTIVLDTVALLKGADILRVHDVKEAVETVKLFSQLKKKAL